MKTVNKAQKKLKQPLAVVAYETIVRKIVSLEYRPGQHLEENLLVEDLEIGRTPVREALVRLRSERMLEAHPKKGVIVCPITIQNAKAMFESIEIIELGIADLAVTKDITPFLKEMESANKLLEDTLQTRNAFDITEANYLFHMNFARCSCNEFLNRAMADVRGEAKRLSFLSYETLNEADNSCVKHVESALHAHEKIIIFLKEKRIDPLKQMIKEHIHTFRERIVTFMVS